MKVTALPNGQIVYQMMSHVIDSEDVTEQRHGANPTHPDVLNSMDWPKPSKILCCWF